VDPIAVVAALGEVERESRGDEEPEPNA